MFRKVGLVSRVQDAMQRFGEGQACSQAVLGAYAASFGLDPGQALRLSAGFATGLRLEGICGAASGAIMVLGLAACDDGCAVREGRTGIAAAVDEFNSRFRQSVGALNCPDIIGCDLRTAEGRQAAQQQGLFASRCLPSVQAAAEILEELLPGI